LVNGNLGLRNFWLNSLRPCGEYVFDYLDPVIRAGSVAERAAISSRLPEFLSHIVREFPGCDGAEVARVRADYRPPDCVLAPEPCPFINLAAYDSAGAFVRALKPALRGDLKRQRNRLGQQGAVEFRSYTAADLQEALATFPEFMKARQARWGDKGPEPAIFEQMLRLGLPTGIVHFSSLHVDGQAISWHLGLAQRSTFYYYIPAYAAEWAPYSPGKLHLAFLVEHALSVGHRTFDLLRGAEKYKSDWTGTMRDLAGFQVPGTRISTGLRVAGRHMGRSLKRNVKALMRRFGGQVSAGGGAAR
jgi:CelD/BcsL family acetyltransferase involved in cellulose biosynthesis